MSVFHITTVHAHDVSKQIPNKKNSAIFYLKKTWNYRVENVMKQLVHTSAVRLSRYEDDMKMIWRCLKMREVPRGVASSNSYASFVLSKLPKCFISQWTHSWRVNQLLREETEVARTVQSYEGEPRASNEDFDEDWRRRCFACSVRSRLEQEIPQPFIPSHYVRQRFPSVIALEFRCCREILLTGCHSIIMVLFWGIFYWILL